ncbi:hypothetical protein EJ110_NYTH10680 [Nymphaea thermarum]|nr:hypothetical protein EJ110_NYTH10680 [Nymphaea thermarum]
MDSNPNGEDEDDEGVDTNCSPIIATPAGAGIGQVGAEGIELLKKPCKQKEDYNFCFTTLQTDSRSRHANLFGLNITAMEIVIKKVTSTLSYISQLLKQKTDRCTKLTLEFGIEELRAKQYHDVNWKISGVIETADFCQSGLTPGGCGGAAALTRQNQNLKNLGNLALSPFSNS